MSETAIQPGYELTLVTKNELSENQLKGILEKVEKTIQDFSGKVVNTEDWGKRKLAYPIQKETRAHYSYFAFTGNPGVVAEIERNLRINEHIIRYMSVNLDREFDEDKYWKLHVSPAAPRKDESAAAVAAPAPAAPRGKPRR